MNKNRTPSHSYWYRMGDRDPEYYLITVGLHHYRKRISKKETEYFPEINPPPDKNPMWYISEESLDWRKEPIRVPSLFREWMHGVLGFIITLMPLVAYGFGYKLVALPLLVLAGLYMYVFLQYEKTEEVRIKDNAYRDIGGFMAGVMGAMAVALTWAVSKSHVESYWQYLFG